MPAGRWVFEGSRFDLRLGRLGSIARQLLYDQVVAMEIGVTERRRSRGSALPTTSRPREIQRILCFDECSVRAGLRFVRSLSLSWKKITWRAAPSPGDVQQFAQGMTNEDLIAGFVGSDEYFNKHTT